MTNERPTPLFPRAVPDDEQVMDAGPAAPDQQLVEQVLADPDRLATVLAVAHEVANQDAIYEYLAHFGAYRPVDEARLRAWGYRSGPVLERHESGLRIAVFRPLPGAAAPTTPQGHAMLQLHGAPLRPVLAFRGATVRQGLLDDVDAQGIASFQLAANVAEIVAALRGARSRVDVVGHGLGGALAQLAAGRYPQAIGRVVTFQAPPVDEQDVAQVIAWNGRVAPHQRVYSSHHRAGPELLADPGDGFTPGQVWTYGLASLEDPRQSMPLSHLAAARGASTPGLTGAQGQPAEDLVVTVRRRVVSGGAGIPAAASAAARVQAELDAGLDRRQVGRDAPNVGPHSTAAHLDTVRARVVEMATSTAFGFRQIVAFVQSQQGLSSQQKVSLQEEARRCYRQGR